jgi:hypothetical protein
VTPVTGHLGALRDEARAALFGLWKEWWPETGLNRRRRPFQGRALPLSYLASVQTSVAISTPATKTCRWGPRNSLHGVHEQSAMQQLETV